jgi:hypothetical protein
MNQNWPHTMAREGKVFAVAPMMDWDDNLRKSVGYGASCAKRVQ